jgi:hypothetical protein
MTEQNRRVFDELRLIASPQGFAVYDTAKRKLSVHAADVIIRPGNAPLLHIALPAGSIDVVGKSVFAVVDPATGKPRVVRKVEWADGEETSFPVPEGAQGALNQKAGGNGAADQNSSPAGTPAKDIPLSTADPAQVRDRV